MSSNSAKFTFLYLLSLIALGFFAISAGNILFQIINKNIVDIVEAYGMSYNLEALRFAISALIVAAPIYFLSVWQINKNLASGALEKDSGIRKWLTYLILLASSMVILGDLIAVIFNFLNGELSLKFALKTLTILAISGAIFSYYFYDMRREDTRDKKNKVIKNYFYITLAAIIIIFVSGILFVESPKVAREKRLDSEVLNQLSAVESAVQEYYFQEKSLPADLHILIEDIDYIQEKDIKNIVTKKDFEYKIIDKGAYELCTDFLLSNVGDNSAYSYSYLNDTFQHEAGYDCIKKKVMDNMENKGVPLRF